jgi:hypothetical protein
MSADGLRVRVATGCVNVMSYYIPESEHRPPARIVNVPQSPLA